MEKIFYIIISILLGLFFVIWIIHTFLNFLNDRQFQKTLKEIRSGKTYKKSEPKGKKTDEKRSKDKQKEAKDLYEAGRQSQQERDLEVVTKVAKYSEVEASRTEQAGRIVGTVKPVGRWSQAVMNQKMGFLKLLGLESLNLKNFWQSMIKAQGKSQGKDKGKGR